MAIPAPSTPQPPRRSLVGLKKGLAGRDPFRDAFSPFRRFDTGLVRFVTKLASAGLALSLSAGRVF